MRHLPGVLVSAVIPAAADFHTRGEIDTLRKLYLRATKYSAAAAIPMAAFLAAAAMPLLKTWVGPIEGLTTAAVVLQVMAIGYIANIVPGAGVSIALGMGHAGLQMRAGFVSMVANIVLTVALALTIGFWGIPLATAASMALSWAWFATAMRGALDLPASALWKEALRWPALVGVAVFAVTALVSYGVGDLEGRGVNGVFAIALAVAAAAIYAIAARWTPLYDSYDRQVIRRVIALPGEWVWKRKLRAG
jgi:O-antigen/teichoic acid export membrane protein